MKVNPMYDNVYQRFGKTLLDKWILDEDKYELTHNHSKLRDMSKTLFKYYQYNGFLITKMIDNNDLKALKMCLSLNIKVLHIIKNVKYFLWRSIKTIRLDFVRYLLDNYTFLQEDFRNDWRCIEFICGDDFYKNHLSIITPKNQIELIEAINSSIKHIPDAVFNTVNHELLRYLLKLGWSFYAQSAFDILLSYTINPSCFYKISKHFVVQKDLSLEQIRREGYLCLETIFEGLKQGKDVNYERFKENIGWTIDYLQSYITNHIYEDKSVSFFRWIYFHKTDFLSYETNFWRDHIPILIRWSKEVDVDCNILETFINVSRKAPINILKNRVKECFKEISQLNEDIVTHVLCQFF